MENKMLNDRQVNTQELGDDMLDEVNGGSIWKEIKGAAKRMAKSLDEWLDSL